MRRVTEKASNSKKRREAATYLLWLLYRHIITITAEYKVVTHCEEFECYHLAGTPLTLTRTFESIRLSQITAIKQSNFLKVAVRRFHGGQSIVIDTMNESPQHRNSCQA